MAEVQKKSRKGAIVLALYGDLGSGKTTLVQEIGKLLGVIETMQSPTFVIMKLYDISYKPFAKLIHIDAYRLEHADELVHLGWNELIADPKNLIALEWADRVKDLLPAGAIKICCKFVDDSTREFSAASL
ncbi:MAG: tRNA (adenosine(37)-N6)-threonylcarbamoyltransferase complex ATPase subunit type 1 TsaE [Candidatus Taylorbacteria bacterium RIFCSPHIGHO2_01_FULL_46_22b]|uniref:tRNA threonylcarbamoyladenosine biosynthesis protein TsaE n=1 Tax=Candidatus Taylorbacteria bacterium RIFCSPHIGHO2_01_FULL_46_22b TaxID=1802301 RepID=A0A1G2M4H4_9BACT|nr:MAG: tRNA (adenosine(37)-N6)-threonylcarbamoyltransferase complex ATPase subunit type 1 TsaE [Candidatus Taylorbacteria bacterium RIFCSPHIGHO2_01_FULL_46_22b]